MADKFYKDNSIGRKFKTACAGSCYGMTLHEVQASLDKTGSEHGVDYWHYHQIIVCQGCKTISFRECSGTSEDYIQIGFDEWISDEVINLYPPRNADLRGLGSDVEHLPDTVSLLYRETRKCLLNAVPILTGIGLRALVETVCKEKGTLTGNLEKRIDKLLTMGVLTATDAMILHHIRSMGNDAAHEAKPHSDEQLALAMEAVENLLRSVYIIPKKIAKFLPKKKPPALPAPK